ncbi:cytochrome c oxidase subunit 1 [Chytridiales sp. JEL 0842]|nr:cytochrome c oxidase subunit 1 [Chytridiales sp. JEL 0842]
MADPQAAPGWVEDMISLPELTETSILENLRKRYEQKAIYTYTGSILVALNPFDQIEIYNSTTLRKYLGKRLSDNTPHIFAIAELAIHNLRSEQRDQSVVISGESGAGKSESTKSILHYITVATSSQAQNSWVQQQVLEANTVLESFGNAKTVRNNNSSRFGKFIQIRLNENNQIKGAVIESYLLEKSRIAKQAKSERNYHVFYEFLAGATNDERTKYNLQFAKDYNYLSKSECTEIEGVSDKSKFENLRLAMTVLKMSSAEIDGIMRALSAILWIGNIEFKDSANMESVTVGTPDIVKTIADLLAINEKKLSEALCFRRLVVRTETTMVPLKPSQATENRDSMARTLYDGLFQKVLGLINSSLKTDGRAESMIGVLDIFGFEVFEVNSFEQFCINFTNEKLQQYFNKFIFKLEQEEYAKESITWEKVTFVDNQECLDLIEMRPSGILPMLDEETRVPKGSDKGWHDKLNTQHDKHKHFIKPKKASGCFGVKHYAGEVLYHIEGFMEKNKDAIQDELYELVQSSKLPFVAKLLKKEEAPNSKRATLVLKPTAGLFFRNQLQLLVDTLQSTTTQYVRCIKPNSAKKAFEFDSEMVLKQLRYSGIMETIKIRKSGYAIRLPFDSFCRTYRCLVPPKSSLAGDLREVACDLVSSSGLKSDEWQAGSTKIFLKQVAVEKLEAKAEEIKSKMSIVIQKSVRRYLAMLKYKRIKYSVEIIQHAARGYICRKKYLEQRSAAIKIQAAVRGWFARDYYAKLRERMLEAQRKLEEEIRERGERMVEAQRKMEKELREKELAAAAAAKERTTESISPSKSAAEVPPVAQDMFVTPLPGDVTVVTQQSAAASKPEIKGSQNLDDMFSFLDDYSVGADINQMAANITSEIDGLLDKPVPSPLKTSSESMTESKFNPEDPEWSMFAYAQKNLELQLRRETMFGKKKGTTDDHSALLQYSKHVIVHGITSNARKNENLQSLAIECFRLLFKAMDPANKKSDETVPTMQQLVSIGLIREELRDEIFVHIVKQMTLPRDGEPKGWDYITLVGWQMMALATSTFPPSKALSKYLLAFIQRGIKATNERDLSHRLASFAERSLKHTTLNGARKLPPSTLEITALRSGRNTVPCKFHLITGETITLSISSIITAAEVVKEIAKKIGLKDSSGWSLYEVSWNNESAIRGVEYIADLISDLEKESKRTSTKTPQTFLKNLRFKKKKDDGNGGTVQSMTQLVLKKRVFKGKSDYIVDPVEHELLYAQAVDEVNRDVYTMHVKEAAKLAALRAQVLLGDFDPSTARDRFINSINDWICPRITVKNSKELLTNLIMEEYASLRGFAPVKAKALYLDLVKTFPHYGAAQFLAHYEGFWSHGENIILMISQKGIDFIHTTTKDVVMSHPYNLIQYFGAENDKITIEVSKVDELDTSDIYTFRTMSAEEIASLIREYAPVMAREVSVKMASSEQALQQLDQEIERTRSKLVESHIVKLPGHEQSQPSSQRQSTILKDPKAVKRLKGLNRLSRSFESLGRVKDLWSGGNNASTNSVDDKNERSMEHIMDDISQTELGSKYNSKDWAFSPDKMNGESIVVSPDRKSFDDFATELGCFLRAVWHQDEATVAEAQLTPFLRDELKSIIGKCIQNPPLCDELYLQLIRMTTNDLEPDAFQSISIWNVMCVAVGIVLPVSPLVFEYMTSHLKRSSIQDPNIRDSQVKRMHCAKYCTKVISKMSTSGAARKCPPSTEEIVCAMKQSSLQVTFEALNGLERNILISPSDTVESIFGLILERFHIQNSRGFALFLHLGDYETVLYKYDKIADIMYNCEQQNTGPTKIKTAFVIQKRLFLQPYQSFSSSVEEDIVMSQVISSMRNNKFPVGVEDCIFIAALNAQIFQGDATTIQIDYDTLVRKYAPDRLISTEAISTVKKRHLELVGKDPADARKVFIDFIVSRPLFGTTIYNVTVPIVSYSYDQLLSYSPTSESILLITESPAGTFKYVFNTLQSNEIASLMRDYISLRF